ncbi:hypothetical protein ACWDV4_01405 [Micromonospora sp. NPDC003197]
MTDWLPDEQQARLLHEAARSGDGEAYLGSLLDSCLVMPTDPDADRWAVLPVGDDTCVITFTTVDGLRASPIGDADSRYLVCPVLDLVATWPDPAYSLVVDPTLETQAVIGAELVSELATRACAAYPLDAALRAARTELGPYLEALLTSEVVVPIWPYGSLSRDLTDPEFGWWGATAEDASVQVVLFSAPARVQARLGDVPWLIAPFHEVLTHWPQGCDALVDPDQPTGARVPGEVLKVLAGRLMEADREAMTQPTDVQQTAAQPTYAQTAEVHIAAQAADASATSSRERPVGQRGVSGE